MDAKSVVVAAALGSVAMQIHAAGTASDGWHDIGGEAGAIYVGSPSTRARAEVIRELEAWRRNPVAPDGWRETGSEVGWTYEGVPGVATRREVIEELERWRRAPVSGDGWRDMGGEAGWVYDGSTARRR